MISSCTWRLINVYCSFGRLCGIKGLITNILLGFPTPLKIGMPQLCTLESLTSLLYTALDCRWFLSLDIYNGVLLVILFDNILARIVIHDT